MIHPQQPSGMPVAKYVPFQDQIAVDLPDRTWPTQRHRPGAALVRGRPARRQPGPHRPDEPGAQEADVRAARADGLQGDRGRVPEREPDRLRLRAAAHRGGPHPRRRDDPGADPVPRPPDRAHLRRDPRRQAGDRALLQLDVDPAAPGRVRPRPGRHHRHRPAGAPGCAASSRRRCPTRRLLRVLPRELHRHRARVRGPDLQRGRRRHRADARPQDDHQPAGHRRDGHAQRLRRLDRVDVRHLERPRVASSSACTRTTTAAPASPPPSWATWPAPTASRAACSATASAPATSTSSPWA